MRRTAMALLAGLVLATGLTMITGCESSDPEDAAMKERRTAPEPRPAPGTNLGAQMGETDDSSGAPPPPPPDDDGN